MTKASTPKGLLALCPNELAGNKKSAICNNANDTVITLSNYAWIRTKLDTYMNSITENFVIVNPFAGKGIFSANQFTFLLQKGWLCSQNVNSIGIKYHDFPCCIMPEVRRFVTSGRYQYHG